MSEHVWAQENLAAYVLDGLDPAERERLERHLAECDECSGAADESAALDRRLDTLFVGGRPGPALEDGLIQELRYNATRKVRWRLSSRGVMVLAAAASVLLALLGAAVHAAIDEKATGPLAQAMNNLKPLRMAPLFEDTRSMAERKEDPRAFGLGADLVGGTIISNKWSDGAVGGKARRPEMQLSDLEGLASDVRTRSLSNLGDGVVNGWALSAGNPGGPLSTYLKGVDATGVPFSPDGRQLARGEGRLGLNWDRETGEFSDNIEKAARQPAAPDDAHQGLLGGAPGGSQQSGWKAGAPAASELTVPHREGATINLVDETRKPPPPPGSTAGAAPAKQNYFLPGIIFAADDAGKSTSQSPGEGRNDHGAGVQKLPRVAQVQKDKEPTKTPPPGDSPPKPGTATAPVEPAPAARKIIRSGEIEFEIDSFDSAVATVIRLIQGTKGGFVATINSEKLPNGKVRGSAVVRVPPEHLDNFVLDLRKELGKSGELKGQRIGSQDITKQYTDLESRLRAARTMEERLLKIIKDGKGEIKDLLLAEKELGVWRTKIEEFEGELRYYGSQVALSTLTITLGEKDIRTAAVVAESERVQMGIETEDVEQAMRDALKAVEEAKGRVTRSELKQHGAGQFNAVLHFEVPPGEKANLLRDRLRQLGVVARFEVDRVQKAEGGQKLPSDGKLERGNTQFMVSLYNLVNVAPRETVTVKLAATDVAKAYQNLVAAAKAKGRVVNASLNEQDRQNVTARVDFDAPRAEEDALHKALADAGEVVSRQVARQPEGDNVTDRKVAFKVELIPATAVPPREAVTLGVEVNDVKKALTVLTAQVKESGGRVIDTNVGLERSGRITARVIYDVPLSAAPTLLDRALASGHVRVHRVTRNPQAPDGKLALARFDITLSNDPLVSEEAGLWSQIRRGLAVSLQGLSVSASFLIIGVLFVLPWALLIYAVVWLVRRLWRSPAEPAAPAGGGTAG